MALQLDRTNSKTHATFPAAYGRIDKASGTLEEGRLVATLNWYVTKTAADAGADAVMDPDIIVLVGAEIDTFRAAALAELYQIIKARPDYTGATDV